MVLGRRVIGMFSPIWSGKRNRSDEEVAEWERQQAKLNQDYESPWRSANRRLSANRSELTTCRNDSVAIACATGRQLGEVVEGDVPDDFDDELGREFGGGVV